ncbi:hypothetical protein OGAPHI_000833 [Ogataea philodendri]|uniref:C2H2-type domain-containing protein n=1 Tax=Ogataea philodendri TaxID=1378263 RepID=A0A9P8PFX7_9ASCO|nr:uncharacterized protein OGAPHI_000833 [Ogataea philodendri]KAH3671122.1 hypothetical protein OGAPHI_000833 [Ogataea philodendri]
MSIAFRTPGNYTCNSCQIVLPTADVQRIHMKTDWHRYNLKRRVAGLTPVESVIFQSKVALQQRQDAFNATQDEFGFYVHKKTTSGRRQPTKKDAKRQRRRDSGAGRRADRRALSPAGSVASRVSEFSLGTVNSGVDSEYTLDDLVSDRADSEFEFASTTEVSDTDDSDGYSTEEEEEVVLTNCFYCGAVYDDEEANVAHMSSYHGLFIPEKEYLTDLSGLLQYLGDTLILHKECLRCGFVGKNTESIRQHIRSKGHCVIPYETRPERQLIEKFYTFDEDDLTTVKILPSGIELPDGRVLGSRSFSKYYKQSFPRRDREVGEGEQTMTLMVADRKAEFAAVARPVIETRREKVSLRQIRKQNNLAHFRDPLN